MKRLNWLHVLAPLAVSGSCATAFAAPTPPAKPNIIIVLADDLGYGDVSCYNSESKIQTPFLDRMAAEGMRFTDAHTCSSVCTPSRYGLLTGRYSWRSRLKHGVLYGYSTALLKPPRETIASLLKKNGYRTACIGKWHLGMDMATTDGKPTDQSETTPSNIDWNGAIRNGPNAAGFDYYFGCAASWDMPPYVWIENDKFTTTQFAEAAKTEFGRPGIKAVGLAATNGLPTLTQKVVSYIETSAKEKSGKPFFLYFPLTAPHAPIAPNAVFKGRSQAGDYGDFVTETDDTIGQLLAALARTGLDSNTLVIVTSDNGPEVFAIARKTEYNHFSAGKLLGIKRDNWDGGHRVPFIARWPGQVPAGSVSGETICLTDLMATAAALAGCELPPNAGEDSYNIWPVLAGEKPAAPIREATVHHSFKGFFAIRQGQWKLLLHTGSGGNRYEGQPAYAAYYSKPVQLYDMNADPYETVNLADRHPEIVAQLTALLKQYVLNGRSTPGPAVPNDTPNNWSQLNWMNRTAEKPAKASGAKPVSAE
ncbi:MAG TPA: arylsulfatase [Pontiellaceae bacterium]|nr:arylsulfatase [Pontiellaceae bacterium]